jgi:ketosteroid isomerase-like protein
MALFCWKIDASQPAQFRIRLADYRKFLCGRARLSAKPRINITSQLDEIMKFLTAADAEHAFYEAFESGDADAVMSVWAKQDDIICIHPQGARLVGRANIEASWREILRGGIGARIEFTELRIFSDQALAVHILYENVWMPGETAPRPPIFATNAYRYSKFGWHLVLHHASPVPYDDMQIENEIFH